MKKKLEDPVLFLIMRNDLSSLNPGKLAAQAAHVANCAVKFANRGLVRRWEAQTPQGFGTTIVLGAPLSFINGRMPVSRQVIDPGYPCQIPYEVGVHIHNSEHASAVVHLDHERKLAAYVRREIMGAWHLGERLSAFDELELYP